MAPLHERNIQRTRQEKRQLRRHLNLAQQQRHAQAACQHFLHHFSLRNVQHIALYCAFDGELNTQALQQALTKKRKKLYLPIISSATLEFTHISALHTTNELSTHSRYRIEEPARKRIIATQQLDIVIVPLTAFDPFGNRLGMGAGYYDRAFAFKKKAPAKQPLLIGYAHENQRVPLLCRHTWDVRLDFIVTERHVYNIKRRSV